MRLLFATSSLILVAGPALALPAPAPLAAVGLPAVAVVGGVFLVTRLFRRK